ncbi:hypothetical protein CYLTODRAFT_397307 [Cylindrobasidium torrendii FP15055 ss-10]|uniref:DUF2423 domain-containing protein n=1 Tax=Cylindrobasidium torrendii FP15055 ss-10 TaxID=1314674 RepID=A0A0D7BB18_9AGAR|nr:hypothetical protein CYLTODRAFT_397307 [Cylindrobasidium torrendii FP15055 ss-10]
MAKSLRSKTKRAHRADKRTSGVYGALEAARLNRLNTKLHRAKEGKEQRGAERDERGLWGAIAAGMDIDAEKVSTHGRTPARNDEWRAAKGMTPRARKTAVNKQGVVKGARKAGRSHRRR